MPSQEYNLIHILRILKKWSNHILIISFASHGVYSHFFRGSF
jgi:hypothetical protein